VEQREDNVSLTLKSMNRGTKSHDNSRALVDNFFTMWWTSINHWEHSKKELWRSRNDYDGVIRGILRNRPLLLVTMLIRSW